jgi:hypothetical protein
VQQAQRVLPLRVAEAVNRLMGAETYRDRIVRS